MLAALLHMGNIKYKGKVVDNLDATDIPDQVRKNKYYTLMGSFLLEWPIFYWRHSSLQKAAKATASPKPENMNAVGEFFLNKVKKTS